MPIIIEHRGAGSKERLLISKTWRPPPKSATATIEASELRTNPQFVIENKVEL